MEQDIYAPSLTTDSSSKRVLIISGDNCHDLEFFYPYYRLSEEGFAVHIATPDGGKLKGKFGMELQNTLAVSSVKESDYDLLYLPGGKAPDTLRKDNDVIEVTRQFAKAGKPIAAICHGAQILAAADVIAGKGIAAWPEVEKEIKEASGTFVNAPCVEDGQFITARWPGDLPGHVKATIERLKSAQTTIRKVA